MRPSASSTIGVMGTSLAQAWTGGQYSLVRGLGGLLLVAHFFDRALAGSAFGGLLNLFLAVAAAAFAVGRWDKPAAWLLAAALLWQCDSIGMLGPFGNWYAAAWMIANAFLPRAPYGSLDGRGAADPRGDWSMPQWMPAAAWALFVAHHALTGLAAFFGGELLVALVAFVLAATALAPSLRALAWSLSLGVEVGRLLLGEGFDGGLWLLHLLALQPAWLPPRESRGVETVFYDGTCALCHGAARFLLSEDTSPARFRLAAIGGDAFVERLRAEQREDLPDSLVVSCDDGSVRVRSSAVLTILDRIGGLWRIVAWLGRLVPLSARDASYNFVSGNRYDWFGRKSQACPILAGDLRARFDS